MIETLVTYLPFHRIHEVGETFKYNFEQTHAKRAIVYVDNIYTDVQKRLVQRVSETLMENVETRPVNWMDRSLTLLNIIEDSMVEPTDTLIVDSDNFLGENFGDLDNRLQEAGFGYYTIMERGYPTMHRFIARSRVIGTVTLTNNMLIQVYGYRVTGTWRGIFFIGRKQAVKLDKQLLRKLDRRVILDAQKALLKMPLPLRNNMSDETTLGFVYYYSGVREVPWCIHSTHTAHESTQNVSPIFKRMLSSSAICFFARSLPKRRYPRVAWMYTRYKLAQTYYAFRIVFQH
jgi:hypothetical protein